MADVTVESGLFTSLWDQWQPGNLVWIDADTGYVFYGTESGPSRGIHYRKTTDGGATWGSGVLIHENAADHGAVFFACWYDRWTPGDPGTSIHIAWLDDTNDAFRFVSLDTSDDSLGFIVMIESMTTVVGGSSQVFNDMQVGLTKTRGGTLAAGYMNVGSGGSPSEGFHLSTNGGVSWSAKAHPLDSSGVRDLFWLFPGDLADDDDLYALYLDVASYGGSSNVLTMKTYDASADSWSESSSIATDVYIAANRNPLAPAFRPSDNSIWLAYTTGFDTASADLRVVEINDANTWTQHTNVISNTDDWGFPVVVVDDAGGEVYVFYAGQDDGAQTILGSVDVHYAKGTISGLVSWGAETAYSESSGDFRRLYAPLALVEGDGGRVGVAMIDDDLDDLLWNKVNSIAVAPAATAHLGSAALSGVGILVARGATPLARGDLVLADARVGAATIGDAARGHLEVSDA